MKKIIMTILIIVLLCPAVFGASYLLKQMIEEGETQVVDVGGQQYTVQLVMVSDSAKKAVFKVNGEMSDALSQDESHKFNDGTSLLAREILVQESGDGKDMVQYNIYAGSGSTATLQEAPAPVQMSEPVEEPVAMPVAISEPVEEEPAVEENKDTTIAEEQPREIKEAKVDMTRVQVKKKSAWERFWDWLKNLF